MSLAAPSMQATVWLSRGFGALTAATFVLIVLGAVVRAHGAGLACPDWPLCFGALVPRFDLRVALEWGHRLLASFVTLGLVGLTVPILRRAWLRERLKRKLGLAWALLLSQVVLGGLTVLYRLAPWTVTSHLLVGSTFCAVLFWMAQDLGERDVRDSSPVPALTSALILLVAALLGAQILLGGLVSSHSAGLACAHFPTCDGSAWAPSFQGLVGLNVLHRLGAYAVGAGFLVLALSTRHLGRVGVLAGSGLRLVILQLGLGVANVVLRLPVEITALHTAAATGLVLVTALLVREWAVHRGTLRITERSKVEAVRAA